MSSNKTFFPVIELWSRLCTKHLKYPEKFTRKNVLSTSLLRQYYFFINGTSHLKFKKYTPDQILCKKSSLTK